MSFLSSGAKSTSTKPNYTGLQVQTSINTLPIPKIWGRNMLAPNVIWYANFQTHSQSQSVGKGLFGGGSSTTYTYSADIMMGICEGPISSIAAVWRNNKIFSSLSALGLTLFVGNEPQDGWSYLFSKYPADAYTYPGTAYVCKANYNFGSSPTVPNHVYEVLTPLAGTGANGVDADPALVIYDFLTNEKDGVRFPAVKIDTATLNSSDAATGDGDAAAQTYWRATGLCFSPALKDIETAQSVLQRWMKLLNCAAVDSGGLLRFIPYGDQAVTGNGVTYVPNMTPIFDLTDDDFQGDESADPIAGSITDLLEAYNIVRLNISDRSNAYSSTPIDARDEAMINQMGFDRADTAESATEICDKNVAAISGQLILQRQLYVRNNYMFKLDARYCGLDPMDIVTLTEAQTGMSKTAVRILSIEEDDEGLLTIEVEELPTGAGTATLYAKQGSGSDVSLDYTVASPVNPPVIFEPPPSLTNNQPQVWIGASGGVGGVADSSWAGAQVYVSLDGESYEYIGDVTQPVRQGTLLADLASYGGAQPDATNTLSVDLTESAGTLVSATSSTAAANGGTMCYVDGEVVSFVTATLTNDDQYALTTLYRGQFGTPVATHAAGSQFARLDQAFFVYDLPDPYVGQTIYLKLASYNLQGSGLQDLSDCVAYTYVPSGAGAIGPVAQALALGTNLDLGIVNQVAGIFDDFGTVEDLMEFSVDLGTAP